MCYHTYNEPGQRRELKMTSDNSDGRGRKALTDADIPRLEKAERDAQKTFRDAIKNTPDDFAAIQSAAAAAEKAKTAVVNLKARLAESTRLVDWADVRNEIRAVAANLPADKVEGLHVIQIVLGLETGPAIQMKPQGNRARWIDDDKFNSAEAE
jgi:hypothetical protein